MPRKIEKNAKSKEEALRLAAEEFGVPIEELSYTVEREIGKGLLGRILGREVIISAWITKEAEEEERLRKTREERRKIREEKAAKAANPNSDASKLNKENTNKNSAKQPKEQKDTSSEKKQQAKSESVKAKAEKSADNAKPVVNKALSADTAEPQKKDGKKREVTEKALSDAQYFAEELIHKMGLADAKVVAENGGTAVNITVSGERMGLLIGKRGDTLDAVQYLTSLYVNKEKNSYIKVNVDTEGYRAKREKTLVQLAHSLERRVLRERKPVTLEPMSPNERRIIHAALQGNDEIQTYSIGEEPNRKLVVSLKD